MHCEKCDGIFGKIQIILHITSLIRTFAVNWYTLPTVSNHSVSGHKSNEQTACIVGLLHNIVYCCLLMSLDIPMWGNIQQYQCNNHFIMYCSYKYFACYHFSHSISIALKYISRFIWASLSIQASKTHFCLVWSLQENKNILQRHIFFYLSIILNCIIHQQQDRTVLCDNCMF